MTHCHEESLYMVFGQVIRFHYRHIHGLLEKVGVYPGQPPLFFALGKHAGLSQKELAEKLLIQPATIAVMLNRMKKAGLIERRPDPDDQRVMRIYLTQAGQKVYGQVKEVLKGIEAECFQNFTVEDQAVLRRLLLQMKDNLMNTCGETGNE